jgi:hypothetical protein
MILKLHLSLFFFIIVKLGYFQRSGVPTMVTMATELFCLNKLLENLGYFHVVFLSVDLRVKRFNVTIRDTIIQNAVQI